MSNRFPRLARSSLSEDVYNVLKRQILTKQLSPGQRLSLPEIEEQMGISRTPLKDALNRLARENLVEIRQRSGTYVSDPSVDEILQSFEVRRVLEDYAAKLASERITESQVREIRDVVEKMCELVKAEDLSRIYGEYVELDHLFHKLIVASAGNAKLLDVWEQVNAYVWVARVRYGRLESRTFAAQNEHEEILRILGVGDTTAVQQAMDQHIRSAAQALKADMVAVGSS